MTIQQIIAETLENLLNATFTAEYNEGQTLLKFNEVPVFHLGN